MMRVDEFDSEFFNKNPGILKAQRFFKRNNDEIIQNMQLEYEDMPDIVMPSEIYINMANNNTS